MASALRRITPGGRHERKIELEEMGKKEGKREATVGGGEGSSRRLGWLGRFGRDARDGKGARSLGAYCSSGAKELHATAGWR